MIENSQPRDGAAGALVSTPEAAEKRVFINDRDEATFICPVCNKGVIKNLSNFTDSQTAVRLKCRCSCGNVYRVLVERRHHFRKPVDLMGRFIFEGNRQAPFKGLLRIRNISQSGVQFTVNDEPKFKVGDRITIEFTLNDAERSQILVDGVVKRIKDNIVGFAFNSTEHYGQLGKYLFR